jgi:hypothetical protein
VTDLRDHLELLLARGTIPTVGVDIAVNYRVSPPVGRVVLSVPAGYLMDAGALRRLAARLERAAVRLDAF